MSKQFIKVTPQVFQAVMDVLGRLPHNQIDGLIRELQKCEVGTETEPATMQPLELE